MADRPGGDPLPDEMAGWRPIDPAEYWEPVITRLDPLSEQEWLAWCEATAGQDPPCDPEEWFDPGGPPPPGEDELTAGELAGIAEAVAGVARAAAMGARLGTAGALAVLAASPGWPRSPIRPPGTTMLTRAPPMMSCSGCCVPGTGSRRTRGRGSSPRSRS